MLDIVRDQGAGMQLRNIKLWKFEYKNIEIVVDKSSDCTSTEFRTPKGILKKTTALFWKQGATTEYELERIWSMKMVWSSAERVILPCKQSCAG
jgi:hypothetical protein